MTPAEKASVARVMAMEWEKLARLAGFPPVRLSCEVKAREAWAMAERWEQVA